jgi:hypothetical protein
VNSENDLPHQQETLQQPHLMKKKSNRSWIGFSILLLIFNFPFVAVSIAALISELRFWHGLRYMISGVIQSMISWCFYVIPLVVVDSITFRSYIKKQSPPWKVFFILLLAINVIFFTLAGWELNQTAGGVSGFVIIPLAYFLVILDLLTILLFLISTKSVSGKD